MHKWIRSLCVASFLALLFLIGSCGNPIRNAARRDGIDVEEIWEYPPDSAVVVDRDGQEYSYIRSDDQLWCQTQ